MSWIMAGTLRTFLMTNGKFGSIWEPADLKKIKVFDKHSEAWETARDRGCDLLPWGQWLISQAKEVAQDKEKQKQYEKERERTAVWQEYPKGLVWKEKENAGDWDVRTFAIFKPERRLITSAGFVMKIQGSMNEVPCFYTYDDDEIEYLEYVYDVAEGGEA